MAVSSSWDGLCPSPKNVMVRSTWVPMYVHLYLCNHVGAEFEIERSLVISLVCTALALLPVVDLRYSASKGKFSLSHTLCSVLFLATTSKSLTPLLCDGGLCSMRVKIVVVSRNA